MWCGRNHSNRNLLQVHKPGGGGHGRPPMSTINFIQHIPPSPASHNVEFKMCAGAQAKSKIGSTNVKNVFHKYRSKLLKLVNVKIRSENAGQKQRIENWLGDIWDCNKNPLNR